MSEARDRALDGAGAELVEGALAALDRPAMVCDPDGRVRGWNDALSEQTGIGVSAAGAAFESVVDCEGDPLARAIDAGAETSGRGTVAEEGGAIPCRVTARPLEAGGEAVGAVVTLDLDGDAAWSILPASVGGEGEYVYAVDASGRLRQVGASVAREAGVAAGDLAGEGAAALADHGVVDEATVGRVIDSVETLVTADRTRATFDARIEVDGDERVLEHRLRAVEHRGETAGAVVVTRDVTERVETTEALRESHGRLSTIVDHLPVVVVVVGEDGRIEQFRGVEGDHFPYDREAVLGARLDTFEGEYPDVVECCRRALDGEELERTVEIGERTFKSFFEPLASAGEREGALITAVDVTERVESERELEQLMRRAELAMDATDTGVWERDLETGEVFMDSSSKRLYGFDSEEVPETVEDFTDRVVEEDLPRVRRQTERAIEEDGVAEAEFRIDPQGGPRRWILSRAVVDDDDPTRMIGIHTDVTDRKERERELERLNTRLQLALEGTATGVWEWDPRTDEVIFDGQMESLFCFEPGEFENEYDQPIDRIHPDDVDDVEAAIERGLEDGSYEAEFRVHVDGTTERWVRARAETYYEDGDPVRMVGICTDVTDRKERERELREERKRFEKLLETSPIGITILNSDGQIVRANERAEDVLGLSRSEITDRTYDDPGWNIVDGDGEPIPGEQLPFSRVMETGEPVFEYEHGIEWPDGTERWLSINMAPLERDGEVKRLISAISDVTERRERRREIRESRRKLRAVVDNSPYSIVMKDMEGRYRLVNDAATELTGLSREEYLGKTPVELFGPERGEEFRERTRRVLETGEPETVEETYGPVGDERIFRTTRTPFHGPDGEMQGTLIISRDVTERRRQQERLETLSRIQQLIHESVGALAAATTQEKIKTTVCERLAGSPFYEFAWIGERESSGREVHPECWAGIGGDHLDGITVTVDPGESGRGPIGRAYRSGEIAVVEDVDDDPGVAPWREAADERECRSLAAVPLTHGATTHGVLVVHADRPDAFGERELAGFEALGGIVGFALSAAQHRRLLESESVVRLEFDGIPEEPAFRTASVERDCRLVFDGVVGTGDGKTLCYLTVEGADADALEGAVGAARRVERATRLDGSTGPDFELVVADSTFQLLANAGARGIRIVVQDGRSSIVAEAPTDVDARQVSEILEANYEDISLTSTEVESRDPGWIPTSGDTGARLTDRQRSVLRAAYYSGYYDWPRETDAETLADSLGVATSTVLQHLRRGHRRVMADLFDSPP